MIDDEVQKFRENVIKCLVHFGNLSEDEAEKRVEATQFFKNLETEGERAALFHEIPYYYAMVILYDDANPLWYKNPALWPPPLDVLITNGWL